MEAERRAFGLTQGYAGLAKYTGLKQGFEVMIGLCINLCVVGLYALANAAAGVPPNTRCGGQSITASYPGSHWSVILVLAFALQGVQPVIDILNDIK